MNPPAPPGPQPGDDAPIDEGRAWLSALADGERDALHPGCAAWREDAAARQTWHAYHLIGDVLRSEELASAPARDAAFLAALRLRLAAEPVVLAPAPVMAPPVAARASRWGGWRMPAAVAAGFAVVAGVLVVTRVDAPESAGAGAQLARSNGPAATGLVLATATAEPPSASAGRAMIRDPQLDAYLNAHQSVRGGAAAALPGNSLRNVELVVPAGAGR